MSMGPLGFGVGGGGGSVSAPLTLASGTITASDPALVITQTWNSWAVTFTAFKIDVTNTASATASLLMDLQVGGTSTISFRRDGAILLGVRQAITRGTLPDANAPYIQLGTSSSAYYLARATQFVTASHANGWFMLNPDGGGIAVGTITTDRGNGYALALNTATTAGGSNPRAFLDIVGTTSGAAKPMLILQSPSGTSADHIQAMLSGGSIPWRVGPTGYQEMAEITAPSAPSSNAVRLYAEDDGGGKTRLMAIFGSGAAQQLAIEP